VIVADANVVVAASTPGHVHHAAARRIVLDHGGDGIVLHSLTLAEVLVAPARTGQELQVRQKLADARFGLSPLGDPPPEHLARVRATAALKMPDACVLATAEQLRVPLATFDRRLAQEASARGTVVLGLDDVTDIG
jgi:predicted nucleic acid-binding protein